MLSASGAAAIGDIYSKHGEWLRKWLHGRTRSAQLAADITQDTFCRLIERKDIGPIQDPRNLLSVIARRLLIDTIRRRDLERAYLACHAHMAGTTDLLTPERIYESVQLLEGITRLLSDLPAEIREAFLLRKIDGLSHLEIAERLRISDRTVKRHIARAYARCYALAYPD